jgi:hypothetical protein
MPSWLTRSATAAGARSPLLRLIIGGLPDGRRWRGLQPEGAATSSSRAEGAPPVGSPQQDSQEPGSVGPTLAHEAAGDASHTVDEPAPAVMTDLDAGMSTVEYAVGTVVAAAFAAVLYRIVTGDSIVSGLQQLIDSALHRVA